MLKNYGINIFDYEGTPLQNWDFFELAERNEMIQFREGPKSLLPKNQTFFVLQKLAK